MVGGGGVVVPPAPTPIAIDEYTEAEASAILTSAGIGVSSSGSCSDPSISICTALEGVKQDTIDGLLLLQQECETTTGNTCDMVVTGGTEVGHATGTYSH